MGFTLSDVVNTSVYSEKTPLKKLMIIIMNILHKTMELIVYLTTVIEMFEKLDGRVGKHLVEQVR